MAEILRTRNEEELTPHEATLRSVRFFKTFHPDEHALARRQKTIVRVPSMIAFSKAPRARGHWAIPDLVRR